MDEQLSVYRKQRKAVADHLAWLDAEIERIQSVQEGAGTPPDEPTPKETPSPGFPQPGGKSKDQQQLEEGEVPLPPEYTTRPEADLAKTRMGCIAVGIAAALGFLFLLFGLPFLIY